MSIQLDNVIHNISNLRKGNRRSDNHVTPRFLSVTYVVNRAPRKPEVNNFIIFLKAPSHLTTLSLKQIILLADSSITIRRPPCLKQHVVPAAQRPLQTAKNPTPNPPPRTPPPQPTKRTSTPSHPPPPPPPNPPRATGAISPSPKSKVKSPATTTPPQSAASSKPSSPPNPPSPAPPKNGAKRPWQPRCASWRNAAIQLNIIGTL